MYNVLVERLPRVEGCLKVVQEETADDTNVFLSSGRSLMLENKLVGRFPLEAVQLTQCLSEKNGIAHALASVQALEDYLKITPPDSALRLRSILDKFAAIYSHIHHFYWEILPDYLHSKHLRYVSKAKYYPDLVVRKAQPGDLSVPVGRDILKNLPRAAATLRDIQQILTLLGGKYPVVMTLIPGGFSLFEVSSQMVMKILRKVEQFKQFVDIIWPMDVKKLIQDSPATMTIFDDSSNFISFGSPAVDKGQDYSFYSSGVALDGKLEPINELKITESFVNTFHTPISNAQSELDAWDENKAGARTWIKGARYETETMLAGALSRMMVTYLGGGNIEISDTIGQVLDDMGLNSEHPNCVGSRILAEALEGRMYMKTVAELLLTLETGAVPNLQKELSFSGNGSGVGKVEAPGGSLYHQVHIEQGRIKRYRIISPSNWNFSPRDEFNRTGVVETELNKLFKNYTLTALQTERIVHSYHATIMDGTQ